MSGRILTYVEIDNLSQEGGNDKDEQNIEKPLLELIGIGARDLSNNCRTETLGCNDTQPSNETANGNINKHALLAVPRANPERGECRAEDDNPRIRQEAWCNDIFLHLLDIGSSTLLGGIDGNDYGANNTLEAADLAHKAQSLFQENCTQNGSNDNTQRTKRSDEDGVDESVCDKVAYLAHNHGRHAEPPPGVLEVTISFTRNFIVFLIGLEKSNLFHHKRDSDEESRADCEDDTHGLVRGRSGLCLYCRSRVPGVQMVCLEENVAGCMKVHDAEQFRRKWCPSWAGGAAYRSLGLSHMRPTGCDFSLSANRYSSFECIYANDQHCPGERGKSRSFLIQLLHCLLCQDMRRYLCFLFSWTSVGKSLVM